MNAKMHFEKHFAKLKSEAMVRSLLAAMIIGFVAGFVAAAVLWFVSQNMWWISVVAFVGVTALCMPIFYFKKYRPTAVRSARRIDRLGLEERLVTMVEYEGNDSIVAELQRKDAKQKLAELEATAVKVTVAKKTLATLAVSGVLGVIMMTVVCLSAFGILPDGKTLLEAMGPEEQIKYVSVTYDAPDGGYIEGDADQLIEIGGNTTQVIAIPDDGFEFVEWSDGYKKPVRSDSKITEDVVFIAVFMPLEGEPQDSDESQESQEAEQEKPKDQQDQQQQQQQQPQEPDPEAPPSNNGGGKYEEANQVIDGETYYKEVIGTYLETLRERLENEGDKLTDEERAIIESYLGIV